MAEELSPETKIYVKEEIEKIKKEFKEEVEKVNSKATKTFTTVALIVGLLTCGGVYGLAAKAIQKGLDETIIKTLVSEAQTKHDKIFEYEKDANDILSKLKMFEQLPATEGYARLGHIKFVWGNGLSTSDNNEKFIFKPDGFKDCFTVITSLAGEVKKKSNSGFTFNRVDGYGGNIYFTYVAIGL